jgi:hypothetical protein
MDRRQMRDESNDFIHSPHHHSTYFAIFELLCFFGFVCCVVLCCVVLCCYSILQFSTAAAATPTTPTRTDEIHHLHLLTTTLLGNKQY